MLYIDTSVLAAYYCPEVLSEKAEKVISREKPAISQLVELELYATLAKKVRVKELSLEDGRKILDLFQSHLDSQIFRRIILDTSHYQLAAQWIKPLKTTLRTLDSLHIAIATHENLTFVTADNNLAKEAKKLAIQTIWIK